MAIEYFAKILEKILKSKIIKKSKEELKMQETLIKKIIRKEKHNKGITLIALVVTTIFSYDENVKSSNNKGFLLQTI